MGFTKRILGGTAALALAAGLMAAISGCSDKAGAAGEGGADSAASASPGSGNSSGSANSDDDAAGTVTVSLGEIPDSIADALKDRLEPAEADDDFTWNASDAVKVTLADGATQAGEGVKVDGDVVTIEDPGTYYLTGTLSDGRLVVDTDKDGVVRLVLDGVSVTSSDWAALEVKTADKVVIDLEAGSENSLTDGATYAYPDEETTEPDAALFSKVDLVIGGEGQLTVNSQAGDGITSKDGLIVAGGDIQVTAADDAIKGRDYLVLRDGTLTLDAGGDGLKTTNAEKQGAGYTLVTGGKITVDAVTDCFDAAVDTFITGGELVLNCGDDGVHAEALLMVEDGQITAESCYEGLEAGQIVIAGGVIDITASDDAINAAAPSSGEGGLGDDWGTGFGGGGFDMSEPSDMPTDMASAFPTDGTMPMMPDGGFDMGELPEDWPTDGTMELPDGMTVVPRDGGSFPGGGQMPDFGQGQSGDDAPSGSGNDTTTQGDVANTAMQAPGFEAEDGVELIIKGGDITLRAGGDGLDSNGTGVLSGGSVTIYAAYTGGEGPIDVVGEGLVIKGGTLVSVSTSGGGGMGGMGGMNIMGMGMEPSTSSTQGWVEVTFSAAAAAGDTIAIVNQDGKTVGEVTLEQDAAGLLYSSADVTTGETYTMKDSSGELGNAVAGEAATTSAGGSGFSGGGQQPGTGNRGGRSQRGQGEATPSATASAVAALT
ncbi:MAG: carbohydrate-binding domain-containing protein [Bifidobacteriaceae bacterium]|jgi:hypothetical protein|nr:carbohydrate-binding domain-containing protein [Bifidobacteriaceae bacterium]